MKKASRFTVWRNSKTRTVTMYSTQARRFDADGDIVTNGGRVLGVTAKGKDLKEAARQRIRGDRVDQFR
ncbi:MAG: hypothetical protein ACLR8P_03480 [Clostridium fessum]